MSMSVLVYCACVLAAATAAMTVAISLPQVLRLPVLSRALLGLALTPFALGTLGLIVVAIWPRAPAGLVVYAPLGVATGILVANRVTLIWAVGRAARRIRGQLTKGPAPERLIAVAALAAVLYVAYGAFAGTLVPIDAHDALIYLNEALAFAEGRAIASIPGFDGQPWDVIAGHPHGFVFQSYLAHALLAGNLESPGYPDDLTARLAFQFTFFCMLAAIGAGAALSRYRSAVAIAILLTLAVAPFQYIIVASSRDAFRIIPLVGLVVALCVPIRRKVPKAWAWAVLCGVLSAWTIQAHSLNLASIPVVALVFGVVYWQRRVPAKTIMVLLISAALCSIFAAKAYIANYLTTGHPLGYGMYYLVFQGTPIEQAFIESGRWGATRESVLGGFHQVFERYGYVVSLLSIAFAALAIVRFDRTNGRACVESSLAACFLAMLLIPLSGILDFGTVNLRGAMLSNLRYPLSTYAFCGVVVAPALLRSCTGLAQWGRGGRLAPLLIAVAVAFLCVASIRKWAPRQLNPGFWHAMFPELDIDAAPVGRWITSDNRLAYYHSRWRPIFLYTKPARPMLAAETYDAVWSLLEEWGVRAVVLDVRNGSWWPRMALYRVLSTSPGVVAHENAYFKTFTIRSYPSIAEPPVAAPAGRH